ncbi:MAG: hypothetical protein ACSLE5_06415 [Porticoccaceae bacterium]
MTKTGADLMIGCSGLGAVCEILAGDNGGFTGAALVIGLLAGAAGGDVVGVTATGLGSAA